MKIGILDDRIQQKKPRKDGHLTQTIDGEILIKESTRFTLGGES